MSLILEIELIPSSTWFKNVRSEVSVEEWDIIRKKVYKNNDYKCEICNGKGAKHPVECHEIWDYNKKTKTQKLVRLIALCPNCHETKHIGLATLRGRFENVKNHFIKVNKCSDKVFYSHYNKAMKLFESRSKIEWELDLSNLKKYTDEPT